MNLPSGICELFQAVRLIEGRARTEFLALGSYGDPQLELVRFIGSPLFRYPCKPIEQVKALSDKLVEIQTSDLSLYGTVGLLPHHYTEWIIKRLQAQDTAFKDFLDLFNHRLLSLYYRAWQKNRIFLNGQFTQSLFALIGYDSPSLRKRTPIQEETLLYYAGFYANRHRSIFILQSILADFFGLPTQVRSSQGKWFFLGAKERTVLGKKTSSHNQLGVSAVVGQRIWDCNHAFKVELGPLHYDCFLQFLPGCQSLKELIALILSYVGMEWSFEIILILKSDQAPMCQLNKKKPFALGQNTWLRTQELKQDTANTILRAFKNEPS